LKPAAHHSRIDYGNTENRMNEDGRKKALEMDINEARNRGQIKENLTTTLL
jgi:hypothetical protein